MRRHPEGGEGQDEKARPCGRIGVGEAGGEGSREPTILDRRPGSANGSPRRRSRSRYHPARKRTEAPWRTRVRSGVAGRLQTGLLTLLRIAIGWHFLYEGHAKFFSGNWTSAGYLQASRWFLGGAFQWMASHPAVIALVDAVNIGGQILIGLLLITGTLTRAASLAAMALLLLYYLANPPLVGLGLSRPRRRPLPGGGPQPHRDADAGLPRRPAG